MPQYAAAMIEHTQSSTNFTNLKTIYVPLISYDTYAAVLGPSLPSGVRLVAEEGEFVITDGVLIKYTGFGGVVTIPTEITEIGPSAFQNNKNVTGIIWNNNLRRIGAGAFASSGLTGELRLPGSLIFIGEGAFQNCTGINGNLNIPDSVTNMGSSAFSGCTGINGTLTLSESLSEIPTNAFYNCTRIAGELVIPDSVVTIGTNAFYGMSGITGIVFGTGVRTIGTSVFYNCRAVEEVVFTGLVVPNGAAGNSGVFQSTTT